MTPLRLADFFHEAFERLAPSFGYQTRTEPREFRPASDDGQLMITVCREILEKFDVTEKQPAQVQQPDGDYQSLNRLQRAKDHSCCHRCGSSTLIGVHLLVPNEHRMEIGRLIGISYSLGPGSGVLIPAFLCPRCGQVQIQHPEKHHEAAR